MIAYLVTNKVNGKRYIGISSVSLKRRWYHHLTLARCGKRKSLMHLAIKKHGPDNFSIEEIACAKSWEDLLEAEQVLIAQYGTFYGDGRGYNMTRGGDGTPGYLYTETTREKIGAAQRGKIVSLETREKQRKAKLGRKLTEEHKAKLAVAMIGRKITWAGKISKAHIGMKHSEESRALMSATRRGKPTGPRSAEAREKIRLGALRREAEKRKNRTQLEIFPTIDGQP